MNPADRRFLKDLSTKVQETHTNVNYLLNDIKVNGQRGIEKILSQQHGDNREIKADIRVLKDRGEVLWHATETIRAKADFWRSWKKLSEKSGVLSFVMRIVTHKVVVYFLVGFLLFTIFLALGYNAIDALEKVYRFFVRTQ